MPASSNAPSLQSEKKPGRPVDVTPGVFVLEDCGSQVKRSEMTAGRPE